MKKQHLSNKDIKKLNSTLSELYGLENVVDRKAKVELAQDEEHKIILIDDKPAFFYRGEQLVPSLHLLLETNFLPKVVVDMPAVKFMVNGADVMRPGIVEIGEFSKGDIVVVVDENNHKPLCIGEAVYSSAEMKTMEKGKVIKSLHYVGDKLWHAI